MTFLANIFASVGLFIGSIFGGTPSYTPPPYTPPAHTVQPVSHASNGASTATTVVSTPKAAAVATTTVGYVMDDNNLFLNGDPVAENIPKTLGLKPSTLGQAKETNPNDPALAVDDGFGQWAGYWPFDSTVSGTADLYTSLATSTDDSLAAFVYTRESGPGDGWPNDTYASILVYSSTGLKDEYNLNLANFSPGFLTITKVDQTELDISQGNGKCTAELYKLALSGNQLTDLGEDPNDAGSDCAY